MWSSIDLVNQLGVKLRDGRCKILMSTRRKDVSRAMKPDRLVEMKPLSEEKGWELFRRRAFRNKHAEICAEEIRDIAQQIAKKCGNLPLAINAVAAVVPDPTDRAAWHSLLTVRFYELHPDMDRDLIQPLKWSYNDLPNDLKIFFLCFASYPQYYRIHLPHFIRLSVSEGLVDSYEDRYKFTNVLRDRSLIKMTQNEGPGQITWITIHNVLHDLAVVIAEKEEKSLFRSGRTLDKFPVGKETECCKRMSLVNNKIASLPTNFLCPTLVTLILQDNERIEEVPESFLRNLPSLKVLDLCRTSIKSLPTSLRHLCKDLVHLDLSAMKIKKLPESIGDLIRLKFLRLVDCRKLRHLPLSIAQLTSLYLHTDGSGIYVGDPGKLNVG